MRILALMAALLSTQAAAQEVGEPYLGIEKTQVRLTIHGVVSSDGHADILRHTASADFAGLETQIDVTTGRSLPPAWSLTTDLALRALAHTQSATAEVTTAKITMRGFTSDPRAWYDALGRLEKNLPEGSTLHSDVGPLRAGQTFSSMCRQVFADALRIRKIEFQRGSTTLSSGAFALLDELVELAMDCPTAAITVSAAGDGGDNPALGHSRVEKIVAYLIEGGLSPERVAGSEMGATRAGRAYFSVTF